jgi:hypothetical protein
MLNYTPNFSAAAIRPRKISTLAVRPMTVPDYTISPAEKTAYEEFGRITLDGFLQTIPYVKRDVLWYYTSASTFATILETNKIWSTQISCLNDTTEYRRSVRLFHDSFEQYIEGADDEDSKWFANYLYTELIQDDADWSKFFVMCMSNQKDDLSQWRAYGGGEGGVAIGLSRQHLGETDASNSPCLWPVSYNAQAQQKLVEKIAAKTLHFFCEGLKRRPGADRKMWAHAFVMAFGPHIVYLAPILKHPAFFQEEEWRLVCELGPADKEKIKIKQRQTLISRHLPLLFGDKLPIREVLVGPCRHPGPSRISVADYLLALKYELNGEGENDPRKVTVSSSDIPFQTM